jgi:V8-like Glu-specific endopeptidase
VEQPRPRTQGIGSFLSGCAVVATIAASLGCWKPTQRAVIAVPAARAQGEGRPLRLLPPFELASTRDAIVRIVGDGGVSCTGTLIADDRVLTAHHCVSARDARGRVLEKDMAPRDVQIELGGDYLPWGEVTVRAIIAPQCGYRSGDGDIAILVLSRHLIGMPTSTARIESPPEVHDDLTVFGFGRCALSPDAIHRAWRDAGKVETVGTDAFSAKAAICPGDSGGPVYNSRSELIGVVSASVMHPDGQTMDTSIFTRVDKWRQLFSAAHEISLGASPSELPPYGECHAPAPRTPARPASR